MDESGEPIYDPDRPRGILTREDRKYLEGTLDRELDANARAQRMYRIRQRIRNSLLDFIILMNWVEETRPALHKPLTGPDDVLMGKAVMALSDYLYRALLPSGPHEDAAFISLWRQGINDGIIVQQAAQGKSVCPSIDVDVNAEDSLPIETVKSALDKDEPVNRQELFALLVAEEISYEQYTKEMGRIREPIKKGPMYAKDRRWRDRLSAENPSDD